MHAAYPFHPTNPSDTSHVLFYRISTALNNNITMLRSADTFSGKETGFIRSQYIKRDHYMALDGQIAKQSEYAPSPSP